MTTLIGMSLRHDIYGHDFYLAQLQVYLLEDDHFDHIFPNLCLLLKTSNWKSAFWVQVIVLQQGIIHFQLDWIYMLNKGSTLRRMLTSSVEYATPFYFIF